LLLQLIGDTLRAFGEAAAFHDQCPVMTAPADSRFDNRI